MILSQRIKRKKKNDQMLVGSRGRDFLLWFTQIRNMVEIVNIFISIILLKRLHNVDTFLRLFHFTYSALCTFLKQQKEEKIELKMTSGC